MQNTQQCAKTTPCRVSGLSNNLLEKHLLSYVTYCNGLSRLIESVCVSSLIYAELTRFFCLMHLQL